MHVRFLFCLGWAGWDNCIALVAILAPVVHRNLISSSPGKVDVHGLSPPGLGSQRLLGGACFAYRPGLLLRKHALPFRLTYTGVRLASCCCHFSVNIVCPHLIKLDGVPNAVGEALRIVCVLPDCRAATNELVQGSKALCAEGSRPFLLVLSMLALKHPALHPVRQQTLMQADASFYELAVH